MKKYLVIFLLFTSKAQAETDIFVGPHMGSISSNPSNGDSNRDTETSYGGSFFYLIDKWMGGVDYSYFSPEASGNSTVNVHQENQWLKGEIRYGFLKSSFTPFLSLGGGALLQKVSTQVFNETEVNQGSYFVRDLGLGLMGRILKDIGVSLSVQYYEYSNVNGFNYFISLGYFPILSL